VDRGFQSFLFLHWTASSLMTLFLDQLPQSGSFSFFVNLWYVYCLCLCIQFWNIANAASRSPFPTLTQVPEASLFWTTATSIILKQCALLLKMMPVSTHWSHADTVLTFSLDCKLIFLPPYSPDLNPIKQAFSAVKNHFRRFCDDFTFSVIDRACQSISSESAWGYFHASGYVV